MGFGEFNIVIKLLDILLERDTGSIGKVFDTKFMKAFKLVGMDFQPNTTGGALWDLKTYGDEWARLLGDKDVNIKVAKTKWTFGSAYLAKLLPWNKIPPDFNMPLAAKRVKRYLNKVGVPSVVYLKPKTTGIQNRILKAVDDEDVDTLNSILVAKNFYADKLGKNYDVRILTKGSRITSIVLDKAGKPFIRSERPRNGIVGFRTGKPDYGKSTKVKQN